MKKIFAVLLVLALAALPALAEAPQIKKVEYEGYGHVEVDFIGRVRYGDLQLSVQDENGKVYAAAVRERDDDDLSFDVEAIEPGKTYSFTISGLRSGSSGDFGDVSGTFIVPQAGVPAVKKVDYDHGDGELEIEFVERVAFENPAVTVIDADGILHAARIIEWDRDSLEVYVDGLIRGAEYTVQVSGVCAEGTASAAAVSQLFTAR